MYPLVEASSGQEWYEVGPVDLSSNVPPSRGISWPRAVLHQVSLTSGQPWIQADLQSDVPQPW